MHKQIGAEGFIVGLIVLRTPKKNYIAINGQEMCGPARMTKSINFIIMVLCRRAAKKNANIRVHQPCSAFNRLQAV